MQIESICAYLAHETFCANLSRSMNPDPVHELLMLGRAVELSPSSDEVVRARTAYLHAWAGQQPEASKQAQLVLDRAKKPQAASWALAAMGELHVQEERSDAAIAKFRSALENATRAEDRQAETHFAIRLAELLIDQAALGEADDWLCRVRDNLPDFGAADDSGAADSVENLDRLNHAIQSARVRAAHGSVDEAVQSLLEIAERAGATQCLDADWKAHAQLSLLYSQKGQSFTARKHDQSAMEALESIAASLPPPLRASFFRHPKRRDVRERALTVPSEPALPIPTTVSNPAKRLLDIIKRLAGEHDIDRLLERITDSAIELSGAERGFVLLVGEDGQLEPHLVRDATTTPTDPSVKFSRSIAEAVLIDGEAIVTVNARDDLRLAEYLSVHELMLQSVACVPIRARGKNLGVLYLEHRGRRGRFEESDLETLGAFADQAALALYNARLLADLGRRETELRRAYEELEQAKTQVDEVLSVRTEELAATRRKLETMRSEPHSRYQAHGIVGRSPPLLRMFDLMDRIRDTDVPVMIQGESGTGKELVARAIHFGGTRRDGPFVALNCGAVPEALLESELFGHVRGAFTGAHRDRAGVLSQATGGTLFLDEIADMPAKMQIDLLRVLQDGTLKRVGASEEERVDVRIICASNRPLQDMVRQGSFREDLYYRLHVVEINLPPLRMRLDDLPLLCDHFLKRFSSREGLTQKRLSKEALAMLQTHPFPGNIRQLEHALLSACVMSPETLIEASDLRPLLGSSETGSSRVTTGVADITTSQRSKPQWSEPVAETLDDFKSQEKKRILAALDQHSWNRASAARALDMPRRTFYRRLKEHGIL